MAYTDFIPQNVALQGTRRIGVYNSNGNRVGQIPLGTLTPPNFAKKLYSFVATADVHTGESTADTDFKKALEFSKALEAFMCVDGDLVHTGTQEQRDKFKSLIEGYEVYACGGNHDGWYIPNIESVISSYTGRPLYYSIEKGNDVFIFVGNVSSTAGSIFTTAELQWLYETLEANRNKRCFIKLKR